MKKLLALLLALVMVLSLFAACGEVKIRDVNVNINADDDEHETEETETVEETEETETTEETENVTEDTTVPEETQDSGVKVYTVTVVDQDGNPISGLMVMFWDETGGMPAITDEEGKAQCQTLNEKTAKLLVMPDGYKYATSQEEWDFTEGDEVTIVLQKIGSKPAGQGGNTKPSGGGNGNKPQPSEPVVDTSIPEETEPTEDVEVDFDELIGQ